MISMNRPTITLRGATTDDARFLFTVRVDPATAAASNGPPPTWEAHLVWLEQALANADRRIWVAEQEGQAVGTVRLDRVPTRSAEAVGFVDGAYVSIAVAPEWRRRGIAFTMLEMVTQAAPIWGVRALYALIKPENVASQGLFAGAGYTRTVTPGVWGRYASTEPPPKAEFA